MGLGEVQWQTPSWNEGAIRIYDRPGTTRQDKARFTLQVPRRRGMPPSRWCRGTSGKARVRTAAAAEADEDPVARATASRNS
ncbi:hypothetical protein H180DRAFT_05647 [Streptomyces sp. WMMB 322]|nr:hypothetical protein H180DRAFT_05647 [Streptomyces sp. WMMB 322]